MQQVCLQYKEHDAPGAWQGSSVDNAPMPIFKPNAPSSASIVGTRPLVVLPRRRVNLADLRQCADVVNASGILSAGAGEPGTDLADLISGARSRHIDAAAFDDWWSQLIGAEETFWADVDDGVGEEQQDVMAGPGLPTSWLPTKNTNQYRAPNNTAVATRAAQLTASWDALPTCGSIVPDFPTPRVVIGRTSGLRTCFHRTSYVLMHAILCVHACFAAFCLTV